MIASSIDATHAHSYLHAVLLERRLCDEYTRTIPSSNSWGDAIKITISTAHYGTEIASIGVETRFGPGDGASEGRALLIYSGIHYDIAVLVPEPDVPHGFCAGVVPAIGAEGERRRVLDSLRALATEQQAKDAYTNAATFDLTCEVSGISSRLFVC